MDDAPNQVLRELIDGDPAHQFDELGILDPDKKVFYLWFNKKKKKLEKSKMLLKNCQHV